MAGYFDALIPSSGVDLPEEEESPRITDTTTTQRDYAPRPMPSDATAQPRVLGLGEPGPGADAGTPAMPVDPTVPTGPMLARQAEGPGFGLMADSPEAQQLLESRAYHEAIVATGVDPRTGRPVPTVIQMESRRALSIINAEIERMGTGGARPEGPAAGMPSALPDRNTPDFFTPPAGPAGTRQEVLDRQPPAAPAPAAAPEPSPPPAPGMPNFFTPPAGPAGTRPGMLQPRPEPPAPEEEEIPNPPGWGVVRAFQRGILRTMSSLPSAIGNRWAAQIETSVMTQPERDRRAVAQAIAMDPAAAGRDAVEIYQSLPDGVDYGDPEAVAREVARMGFNPGGVIPAYEDLRLRDAAQARNVLLVGINEAVRRGVENIEMARWLNDQAQQIPMMPSSQRMQQVFEETPDTFGDTIAAALENPMDFAGFMVDIAAESSPQIGLALATAVATRSPTATTGVLGLGTVAQEYGPSVDQFLMENGVRLETREDAIALLNNPALIRQASDVGLARGVVIAAFEMLGQGLAASAILKSPVGNALIDTTTQALTGSGGEAAAQYAAGQDMSAREILLEGLAEGVTAPAEVAAALMSTEERTAPVGEDPQRNLSPRLTEEDRASPIPNDVLDVGLATLEAIDAGLPLPQIGLDTAPEETAAPAQPPAPAAPTAPPSVPEGAVPMDVLFGPLIPEEDDVAAPEPQAATPAATPAATATPEQGQAPAATPAAPATPAAGSPAAAPQIEVLDAQSVQTIETDAATFQYKSGGNERGVTDRLRDVQTWDPTRAGIGLVYEYADGRRVIADGHQRLDLAQRLAREGQDIDLPVRVLREADGVTPSMARLIAAQKNIAEGTGNAIDTAKILRETGANARDLNLPRAGQMVRDGENLAKLSDDAFGMVVNEVVSPRLGSLVGQIVQDSARHADILKTLARVNPPNLTQAESIIRQAEAASTTETQTDLFGEIEVEANLYMERARVLDETIKRLGREANTFRILLDRGETIEGAGNVLATDENTARLSQAERARSGLMRQANMKGPISDALNEAASALREGRKIGDVVTGFLDAIRRADQASDQDGQGDGGNRPGDEPAEEGGQDGDLFGDQEAAAPQQPEGDVEAAPAPSGPPVQPAAPPPAAGPRTAFKLADLLSPEGQKALARFRDSEVGLIMADMDQLARRAEAERRNRDSEQMQRLIDDTVAISEALLAEATREKTGDLQMPDRDDETGEWVPDTGQETPDGRFIVFEALEHLDMAEAMGVPVDTVDPWATGSYNPTEEIDMMPEEDIFPAPDSTNRYPSKEKTEFIPTTEAEARVAGWKQVADDIGKTQKNAGKIIISLFDYTGTWSEPWERAGYQVIRHDIKTGSDLLRDAWIRDMIEDYRKSGMEVYGVLSACPCTTFTVSGARWWDTLHDVKSPDALRKVFGEGALSSGAESPLEYNLMLLDATREVIALANPTGFHVLENPRGRIQRVGDLPPPTAVFDPFHFGNPYTKETFLYGNFDADMPMAPVEPTEGSMIQSKLRGDNPQDKEKRSTTPEGFAYAFFMANDPDARARIGETPAPPAPTPAPEPAPAPAPVPQQAPTSQGTQRPPARQPLLSTEEQSEVDALFAQMADIMRTQTNAGLDPQLLSMAVRVAEIYVKAGMRRFSEFAQAFAEKLNMPVSKVSRYVRAAYNETRAEMEVQGESVADMDDERQVQAELARLIREEKAAAEAQPEPAPAPAPAPVPPAAEPADPNAPPMVNEADVTILREFGDDMVGARLPNGNIGVYMRPDDRPGMLYQVGSLIRPGTSGRSDMDLLMELWGKPDTEAAIAADDEIRQRWTSGFARALREGRTFETIVQARKLATSLTGTYDPSQAKMLEESIEAAIVIVAREIATGRGTDFEKYAMLVDLYERQPVLAQRTATSVEMQAYSTPAPLAFIASRLARMDSTLRVYEPTAGNGMLLLEASDTAIQANELQADRAATIRGIYPGAKVTTENAVEHTPAAFDVLLTNPPFGKVRDDLGVVQIFPMPPFSKGTTEIDHAIAARALAAMPENGRAVLIIGGKNESTPELRKQAYQAETSRRFMRLIYDNFNVTTHITVDGSLYSRQGASWPVDVIVIEGKGGKRTKPYPMTEAPPLYGSWDALGGAFDDGNLDTRQLGGGAGDGPTSGGQQAPDTGSVPLGAGTETPPPDLGIGLGLGPDAPGTDGGGVRQPPGQPGSRDGVGSDGLGLGNDRPQDGNAEPDVAGEGDAEPQSGGPAGDGGANLGGVPEPGVPRGTVNRENTEAESTFQVKYTPRSSATFAVGTLVPRNMQVAMTRALDALEARVGNIDVFVARELGYTLDELLGVPGVRGYTKQLDALNRTARDLNARIAAAEKAAARPARTQTQTRAQSRAEADLAKLRRDLAENRRQKAEIDRTIADDVPGQDGYFSAEQVDALALAIDNVQQGRGFIVGDQTGVGKGRVVAAMLRYAMRKNLVPVFVTKDKALYGDMIRDLRDIGMPFDIHNQVFATNENMRGKEAIPLTDGDPDDRLFGLTPVNLRAAISTATTTGRLPDQYKMIFTTYSQMQQVAGTDVPRMDMMARLAPGAMFVLDEAHEAGGGAAPTRQSKEDAAKRPRSEFFRALLMNSAGAIYSSATYAKNPNVMSLYGKTDLSLMVDNMEQLAEAVNKGGVPLQQVMAAMLVDSGQYARRERSFPPASTPKLEVVQTDLELAEKAAEALRAIFRLDLDFMEETRKEFIKAKKDEGQGFGNDTGVGEGSMSSVGFASVMHNLAAQFLLSIKVDPVVEMAIDTWKNGRKPIIALSNTNASAMAEQMDDMDISPGDRAEMPFNVLVKRYLERLKRITARDPEGNKYHIWLTDDDIRQYGPPGTLEEFDRVVSLLDEANLSGLPGSPIDAILDRLRAAGIPSGEITGRGLVIEDGILTRRDASSAAKKRMMNDYNSGRVDALVINRSGSTGFSLHATNRRGNDGKQRHMIILQAEPNIDVFMQMLGRIHRTGQTQDPLFSIVVSNLAVEKRPAAVLMRKLSSLLASTTAANRGAVSLDNVTDFLNPYGDRIVVDYLRENPMLGIETGVANRRSDDNLAAKFTGRLAIMPPEQVNAIFDDIETAYRDLITELDALGINTLEAKLLPLEAKTLDSVEIVEAKDPDRPFGQAAMMERVSVKRLGKPYSSQQVQEQVDAALGGANALQYATAINAAREAEMPALEASIEARRVKWSDALAQATTDKQRDRAADALRRLNEESADLSSKFEDISALVRALAPGKVGHLTRVTGGENGGTESLPAVTLGLDMKRAAGKPVSASQIQVRVAVADAAREMRIPLSRFIGNEPEYRFGETPQHRQEMLNAFDAGQTETREERMMITGNIPAGFAKFPRGIITLYTDDSGVVRQGVLMPGNFDPKAALDAEPVYFEDLGKLADFLAESPGSRVATDPTSTLRLSVTSAGRFSIFIPVKGSGPFVNNRAVKQVLGDWGKRGSGKGWRKDVSRDDFVSALEQWQADLGVSYLTNIDKDRAREMTGQQLPDVNAIADQRAMFSLSDAASSAMPPRRSDMTPWYSRGQGVAVRSTPIGRIRARKIAESIEAEVRNAGLADIDVEVVEQAMYDGSQVDNVTGQWDLDGVYMGHTIIVAMQNSVGDPVDTLFTVRHEIIHALRHPRMFRGRPFGLFTQAEWNALENYVLRERPDLVENARALYSDLIESEIIEEAIANAYAEWAAGRGEQMPGMVKMAMRRIARFLRAVRDALTGQGITDPFTLFEAVQRGDIGGRGLGLAPEGMTPRFARAAQRNNAAASSVTGVPVTSGVVKETPSAVRRESFLRTAMVQPLDAVMRIPFAIVGGIDQYGRWRWGRWAESVAKYVLTEAKMGPLSPLLERARYGLIDRYGLPEDYVVRERRRTTDEALLIAEGREHLESIARAGMSTDEVRVLHAILTGEDVGEADMVRVAEPIRKAIDQMGLEAVELGLISRESFERNRGKYLHRVYAKNELQGGTLEGWFNQIMANRRQRLIGEQFKGRGIFEKVKASRLFRESPEFLEARRGKAQKGDRVIILDLISTQGTAPLDGMQGPDGRRVKRVFWPAEEPIPERFNNYENRGTFEVREVGTDEVVLWRDFTPEERRKMGEIVDARYTIAKTYALMAHDLATGRLFRDLAQNPEWSVTKPPEGAQVDEDPERNRRGKRMGGVAAFDWVKVPETKIPKSDTYRYGALAGRYVRASIWRDMEEVEALQTPGLYRRLLTQWKLNKTARSPVVHMNNVMSNIMLMDMADVRIPDLVAGITSFFRGDDDYREAMIEGAFGSDIVRQELSQDVLAPLLREIEALAREGEGPLESRIGTVGKIIDKVYRIGMAADEKMLNAYQLEDQIFRMALYKRRRAQGMSAAEAAAEAREQFIDYDIRAPWINALRATVLPFIGYTYRAVPMLAKTMAERPWKILKYMAIYQGLNALAYAMAPSDWDEDEERKSMRPDQQGFLWVGTERMLRLPLLDEYGNPVFLDVRRWIPSGDVFDLQGDMPAPLQFGGPLLLAAEVYLNRSAFTGEDIVNPMTDTRLQRMAGRAQYLYQSWMPSAPWIPGSFYQERIGQALGGGLQWGSNTPYSLGGAVMSSFGVKVTPVDVEVGNIGWQIRFDAEERALNEEARVLRRDMGLNRMSQDTFDSRMADIVRKRERLAERRAEQFGP